MKYICLGYIEPGKIDSRGKQLLFHEESGDRNWGQDGTFSVFPDGKLGTFRLSPISPSARNSSGNEAVYADLEISMSSSSVRPNEGRYWPKFNSKSLRTP